jgi:hypothetical protein
MATIDDNIIHKIDNPLRVKGSKWTTSTVIQDNTLVNNGGGIVPENGADSKNQDN